MIPSSPSDSSGTCVTNKPLRGLIVDDSENDVLVLLRLRERASGKVQGGIEAFIVAFANVVIGIIGHRGQSEVGGGPRHQVVVVIAGGSSMGQSGAPT